MTNQKISEEQKAAARATKPQWLNINDVLYYQSKAGDELRFDLDFSSEVFERAMSGEEDERGQFFMMLDALGDEHTVKRVRQMGALEQSRVISRFFKEFAKAVDAELGESGSSSVS